MITMNIVLKLPRLCLLIVDLDKTKEFIHVYIHVQLIEYLINSETLLQNVSMYNY